MIPSLKNNLEALFLEQLNNWPQAKNNYSALDQLKYRSIDYDGFPALLQYNPVRIVSSAAKVDAQSIKERRCFLCPANRPPMQKGLPFKGVSGTEYQILLNPLPIFPKHLTIVSDEHMEQRIAGKFEDLLELASLLDDYVVFYNGPKCGASAPDHLHFQAGNKGFLPIEKELPTLKRKEFYSSADTQLSFLTEYINGGILIESSSSQEASQYFYDLINMLSAKNPSEEPMINVLVWKDNEKFTVLVVLRAAHRPLCYFLEGEDNILLSPACVDFGGVFITPLEKDFNKITANDLKSILEEVCLSKQAMIDLQDSLKKTFKRYQPKVSVGIMFEPEIKVEFSTPFMFNKKEISGLHTFKYSEGKILWNGNLYDELFFEPEDYSDSIFELKDVTIGINFHWERKENQKFQGGLVFIIEDEKLTAINLIGVEDYLISVISSEMSATATKEFLKAHSVISRSWLIAQMDKSKELIENFAEYSACYEDEFSRIKWYDREDHNNFDVCADDHCQRYQGITRASTQIVREVIDETWGEVLYYNDKICDARFSKCCGGITEKFATCWEDAPHPYLVALRDTDGKDKEIIPDLTIEKKAEKWILSSPEAFCNTTDKRVLSQALNNYDQETTNFYRWRVEYTQEELSELIKKRSGIDFGDIIDLVPVERGVSGRLIKLKIAGMKRTMIIGKELEIRKTLSTSHLYSSAFIVKKEGVVDPSSEIELPKKFILIGAGWGHGVGLCQIGAAVMGDKGYKYQEILLHYYVGAQVKRKY